MTTETKPQKQAPRKAPGKRPATIRVTSTGKPPLSGAAAFARLLIVAANKGHAMPAGPTGGTPSLPSLNDGRAPVT